MKRYKHWLKIHGCWSQKATLKAWDNLNEYLKKYPTAKITVYNLTAGNMFHKFFCLECEQSYNDLDLDCNSSFDGSLIRLTKKPSMLEEAKDFDTLFNIYTKQVV